MKKTTALVTSLLLLSTSVTACMPGGSSSGSGHTHTHDAKPGETTEVAETSETLPVLIFEPTETNPTGMFISTENPVYSPEPIETGYVPADYGRIMPFTDVYNEGWSPEETTFLAGFHDLEGNVVCGAVFDKIYSYEELGMYMVRITAGGVAKYGFLSYDGSLFTGMIFDGAAAAEGDVEDGVCFYGTTYSDGKLVVTSLDAELNELGKTDVAIDKDQLGMDPSLYQMSVTFCKDGRVYVIDRLEYYSSKFLVDAENGDVLYRGSVFSAGSSGLKGGELFGNVIVEQDADAESIRVIDLDGKVLLDEDAYSWKVCEDKYMVAFDGRLSIYNGDWEEVDHMDIADDAIVMSGFGNIAVYQDGATKVYNKDLDLIAEPEDVDLSTGAFERDWYGYGEGDMYFNVIRSDNYQMINLNTGARVQYPNDFDMWFYGGFFVSNQDYGRSWKVYDSNFNLINEGEGKANAFIDGKTGEVYILTVTHDSRKVWSLNENKVLFECEQDIENMGAYDGVFSGTVRKFSQTENDESYVYDMEGNIIFQNEIETHHPIGV